MSNLKGIKLSQLESIIELKKLLEKNGLKQNSCAISIHDNYKEQKKDDPCKSWEDPCKPCDDSCGPCDLCAKIKVDPIDIEKNGVRLVSVKIKVTNICFDKEISVACIIYDKCHKILAFKGFTTILCKEDKCGRNECGTIERKLLFVLPDDDMSDPDDLEIRTIANYIHPCDSNSCEDLRCTP